MIHVVQARARRRSRSSHYFLPAPPAVKRFWRAISRAALQAEGETKSMKSRVQGSKRASMKCVVSADCS